MTSAGIEPATFQFVAQHLNHCATDVPRANSGYVVNIKTYSVRHMQIIFSTIKFGHMQMFWPSISHHHAAYEKEKR